MRSVLEKIACFLLLIGLCCVSKASVYSFPVPLSGEEDSRLEQHVSGRWELSVSSAWHSIRYKDPDGYALSDYAAGGGVRALYYLSSWLALGAEGELNLAHTDGRFLLRLREERVSWILKAVFSPDVSPRGYVFVGPGVGFVSSRDVVCGAASTSYPFVQVGAGNEAELSDSLSLGIEYGALYSQTPDLNRLMRRSGSWEPFLRVRVLYLL